MYLLIVAALMVGFVARSSAATPDRPRADENGSRATADTPAASASTPWATAYGAVTVLPTYPVEAYHSAQVDAAYNWPYLRFDRERFLLDEPQPELRSYRLVVLENELLRVIIMPEMGGRIWQVVHKPTGHAMFYQNSVVKPSPWGPVNQGGWTGLGGLEWSLPVVEHGYDWGTPWEVRTFHDEGGAIVARISTPDDGRYLRATIDVRLPPGAAYFEIEPQIQNVSDTALDFDFWHNAMLAPGPGNHPSSDLRFLLPGEAVRIHSTGDEGLPGPDSVIPWPRYRMRDLSRLGEWDQYLGVFEYPAAHGPFVGVYEPGSDAGAVRVFPAQATRGSKVFGLGWHDALASEYYTDDGSAYVELHGGLAPTFSDRARLDAGESTSWRERWYPVHGIGRFAAADEAGALAIDLDADVMTVSLYPSADFTGDVVVSTRAAQEAGRQPLSAAAGMPVTVEFALADLGSFGTGRFEMGQLGTGSPGADSGQMVVGEAGVTGLTVSLEDANGATVLRDTVESP